MTEHHREEQMTTAEHLAKANDLAEKITSKAEDALSRLDREMVIMKWPADFRAIMWEAVAHVAMARATALKAGNHRDD